MISYATLDYGPLTAPVSRADVAAFRKRAKSSGVPWAQTNVFTTVASGVAIAVSLLLVFVFGGFIGTNLVGPFLASRLGLPDASAGTVAVVLVIVVLLAIEAAVIWLGVANSRRAWVKRCRVDRFAQANGLVSAPLAAAPAYPGAIFSLGGARTAYDRLHSAQGRTIDLGSYSYTTGSGKNATTHSWGYIAIQLDRQLPQIVLDARANNAPFGATNLPERFSRNQVLSLEGDFDRHFTLYCPSGYERDALYIFTPDLMALLIDNASTFDVELVDDWMFAYSSKPIDVLDPAELHRVFQIIDTVGAKTLSQSQNYRDERMLSAGASATPSGAVSGPDAAGDPVAPQGRRLTKGVRWVSTLVGAAFVIGWLYLSFVQR